MGTIVTMPELKEFLDLGTDTSQDKKLQLILTSLDAWIRREFEQYGLQLIKKTGILELRDGEALGHVFTRKRPIIQVTSVHVSAPGPDQVFDSTTLIPNDEYVVLEEEGKIQLVGGELAFLHVAVPRFAPPRNVFARAPQSIQIIYDAGFDPIPQDIKLALLTVVDSFSTRAGKSAFSSEKLGDYTYKLRESEKAAASGGSAAPKDMMFELRLLLSHYLKETFTIGA